MIKPLVPIFYLKCLILSYLFLILPSGILKANNNISLIEKLLQQATEAKSQDLEKAVHLSKEIIQLSNQNNLTGFKAEADLLIC